MALSAECFVLSCTVSVFLKTPTRSTGATWQESLSHSCQYIFLVIALCSSNVFTLRLKYLCVVVKDFQQTATQSYLFLCRNTFRKESYSKNLKGKIQ